MTRRHVLVLLCVACVIAAAAIPFTNNLGAHASHLQTAKIPVHATLSMTAPHVGDPLTIDVRSVPHASLVLQVTYAAKAGFKKKGKTDGAGHWAYTWQVHSTTPGSATAAITIRSGQRHRHYTLHFAIRAVSSPTPTTTTTPILTGTPTPAPTVTRTPTATPVPRFILKTSNGTNQVIDSQTNVNAATSSYHCCKKDQAGHSPSPGNVFFFLLATEANNGATPYFSAYSNFALRGGNGVTYAPNPGIPVGADTSAATMPIVTLQQGGRNGGWMEFQIPLKADVYTVMWNEGHTVNVGLIRIKTK